MKPHVVRVVLITLLIFSTYVSAQENVRFNGSFESGQLKTAGSRTDGFFLQTLPDPQGGVDYVNVGSGGAGPDSGLDARVVSRESVGSEIVRPRKGNYFFRGAIYFDKDYSRMPANINEDRNKPRFTLMMGDEDLRFDYDEEGFLGFSVYTPRNFEHELGIKDFRGGVTLLSTNPKTESTAWSLKPFVAEDQNEAHWWFIYNTNDTSTREGDSKIYVDLGPVRADIGKWTDFVIRFRLNPFSVDTNPAALGIDDAKDKLYEGNKGILQLWKGEGSVDEDGNRKMVLKLDLVNTPVGLVPLASERIHHSFRQYKFGWHHNPTTVKGPIWFGFDEIRYGLVDRDGTSYSDVHPAGLPCPEGCSAKTARPSETKPNPPGNLTASP